MHNALSPFMSISLSEETSRDAQNIEAGTVIEPAPCAKPAPTASTEGRYHVVTNEFIGCDWCAIFNTSKFFDLHKNGSAFYFQLCLGSPLQSVGVVHFTEVEPGSFRSPRRGTFGGFEFSRPLRLELIEHFVDEVEDVLKQNGARRIELVEPPANFDTCNAGVIANVLARRGYVPTTPDLAYLLRIDDAPLWDKLKQSRRQRIQRCQRQGITAGQVGPNRHREVYDVIVENRNTRHFPVTMTYDAIQEMVHAFPDRILFFGAFDGSAMIASSICVKVSSSVLYVFYWGDRPGYEHLSPVTLLAQCIYDYAKRVQFNLIDFGTATNGGEPIYGLINFKREIGCVPSPKSTYVKLLA
jgi:Acetyltransferase (GNAT) domain